MVGWRHGRHSTPLQKHVGNNETKKREMASKEEILLYCKSQVGACPHRIEARNKNERIVV